MKKQENESQESAGLSKEYFYFLINQNFEFGSQLIPSAEQIDRAIEKTVGLVKKVLECSFSLSNFKDIAQELNLTNPRVQQLYSQGINDVCKLIKKELENQQQGIDENN